MLTKPTISLNLADKTNSELLSFANTIAAGMAGNSNFPSAVNPTLLQYASLISDFSDAVTAWGDVHNRGSHVQQLAVQTTREALEQGLTGIKLYCENTTPYDAAALASAGFDIRLANVPVGILPMVQDLHQFISRIVPSGAVKLKWKRPLAIKPGSVNSYKVLRGLTSDVSAAEFLGISTKTSFTDLEAANQPTNFYWVIPVGAAGDGVLSDAVAGYPIGPISS